MEKIPIVGHYETLEKIRSMDHTDRSSSRNESVPTMMVMRIPRKLFAIRRKKSSDTLLEKYEPIKTLF
jgi:hypothetical protein